MRKMNRTSESATTTLKDTGSGWLGFLGWIIRLGKRRQLGRVRVCLRSTGGPDREGDQAGVRKLIVCVHGYVFGERVCRTFWELARTLFTDCDVMFPIYPASLLSNSDPYRIASEIRNEISAACRKRDYEDIVLVGCSSGALLVRKALLLELEETDEGSSPSAETWARKVERMVLLAGLSRGWSFAKRPQNMSLLFYSWNRLATNIARLPFWGNFIVALERGAPFVADLRVEWIRAAHAADPNRRLPPVVHVLGDTDDFIRDVDNRDVLITADSILSAAYGRNQSGDRPGQ